MPRKHAVPQLSDATWMMPSDPRPAGGAVEAENTPGPDHAFRPTQDVPAAIDNSASTPTISGYHITHMLGCGGQGKVWQAVRQRDNHKVAVKVLPPSMASKQSRARFRQGIQALALLDHPHIVTSLEFGELPDGTLWHAMEYVSGWTLTQYVARLDSRQFSASSGDVTGDRRPPLTMGVRGRGRRGAPVRFPLHEVLALVAKVAGAVEAAHRVGVLHRDLKPSNILVDESGEPRLVDFGLARLPEPVCTAAITLTDQFIGSPAWAAPEQVEGRPGMVDVRTDVYALGVVLYQSLTGDFPYPTDGPLARTFDHIVRSEPTPPTQLVRFIDRELQAIMLKCLAKRREDRYASMTTLREDLERYLRGEPVQAKSASLVYVAWKLARRHRFVVAAAAAGLLATAVYVPMVTWMYQRSVQAEAAARHRYQMASDTLDFLVRDIDEGLRNVAGAGPTRRALLEKAYTRLTSFIDENTSDPAIERNHARLLVKLGDIAAALGRLDDAEAKRKAALDIRRRHAQRDPDDASAQEELSINLVLVGDTVKARYGELAAREWYEQALAIDEQLAARFPDDIGLLDNRGYSYQRLTCLFEPTIDARFKFNLLEKRRALVQRLLERDPDHPWRRYAMVTCIGDYAWYYTHIANDRPRGSEFTTRRLAESRRLVADFPQIMSFRQQIVYALCGCAELAMGREDWGGALALGREAVVAGEELLAMDPHNTHYAHALSGARQQAGMMALTRGRGLEFLEHFEAAVAVWDRFPVGTVEDPMYWIGLEGLFDVSAAQLPTMLASAPVPLPQDDRRPDHDVQPAAPAGLALRLVGLMEHCIRVMPEQRVPADRLADMKRTLATARAACRRSAEENAPQPPLDWLNANASAAAQGMHP